MSDMIYEQEFYNPYIKTKKYEIVKDIVDKLFPNEAISNTRSPNRIRRHILMYIVNLINSKNGKIAVSRKPSHITKLKSDWHSSRYAIKALDLIIDMGLVDYKKGQNSINFDTGFASVINMNETFKQIFNSKRIQPEINEDDIKHAIVNKSDEDSIVAIGKHFLEKTERIVGELNKNYFSKIELTHKLIKVPYFLKNVVLTRMFDEVGCGRFYQRFGVSYQTIDKKIRQNILLNGKETLERDYSGMHINLLYNRVGSRSPYLDNYLPVLKELKIEGDELRSIIKHCVFVMINAKNYKAYVVSFNRKQEKRDMVAKLKCKGVVLKDVYDAVCKVHSPICKFINSNSSISLMLDESNIMQNVLYSLYKEDILALPLHDSVIFQEEYDEKVTQIMKNEYEKYTGFKINVELKNVRN